MATTLTTQWQNVAYYRYTTSAGSILDFYIDARYTSQTTSPLASNIETKLRSVKVTSWATGGSGYNFTLSYSSGRSGTGVWNFGTEDICTGSGTVTHNADGTKTVTLNASVTNNYLGINFSFSGDATLPTIITKPSLSITGAGTSTNHLVMSANTNTTVSVTNTQGRSTAIKLDVTNTSGTVLHTYSLATITSDASSKTVTIPIGVWDYMTDTWTSSARCKIYATNTGGESRSVLYLELASTVKPTISTLSVTASNSISGLGSNFVKGLTVPIITTTASGVYSSAVNRYTLTELTGYNGTLPASINQAHTLSQPINASGTITIKTTATDTRNRTSAVKTSTITAYDWSEPILTCSVARCNSSGTLQEDGAYGKLVIDYKINPITKGSSSLNTKSLKYSLNGTTWTTITLSASAWEGTQTKIIGGSFATNQNYPVYVRLNDIAMELNRTLEITPSFTTMSFRHGGKGVSFGQVASQDEFHSYMQTHIHNGLYIGNTLVLYDDGN